MNIINRKISYKYIIAMHVCSSVVVFVVIGNWYTPDQTRDINIIYIHYTEDLT